MCLAVDLLLPFLVSTNSIFCLLLLLFNNVSVLKAVGYVK